MGSIVPWVLVAISIGLGIWDIFLAADRIKGNTISEVIRSASRRSLMIPFIAGIIIGHWFW